MRKCPKCGKIYDDSWKVCLNCSLVLADDVRIQESNPELRINNENEMKGAGLNIAGLAFIIFAVGLVLAASLNPTPTDPTILISKVLAIIGCSIMNIETFGSFQKKHNITSLSVLLSSFSGVAALFFASLPLAIFCTIVSICFFSTKQDNKGLFQVLTGLAVSIFLITAYFFAKHLRS